MGDVVNNCGRESQLCGVQMIKLAEIFHHANHPLDRIIFRLVVTIKNHKVASVSNSRSNKRKYSDIKRA